MNYIFNCNRTRDEFIGYRLSLKYQQPQSVDILFKELVEKLVKDS